MIRLVVKSRRRLVREAICGSLAGRPGFSIVGQAASIDALVELCTLRRPDVALVDAVELTVSKVDELRQVRSAAPDAELVVAYGEASAGALEVAAAGGITELVPASQGLDAVVRRVQECAPRPAARQPNGLILTEYDVQLASLLSSGCGVRAAAGLLHVSPRTVENRKRRLYAKLGVGSSSHAVSRLISLGVIDPRGMGGSLGMIGSPPAEPAQPRKGRSPLMVVVHGPDSFGIDAVMRVLLGAGLPVVRSRTVPEPGRDNWASCQRGPVLVVLVDPTDDDWLAPRRLLGAHTIVVLSARPDPAGYMDMLLRGACALVYAEDVTTDLVSVLSVVMHGYLVADAALVERLAGGVTARPAGASSVVPALTPREHDIVGLLARGFTIRQAAHVLGVTPKTVENAQGHVFRKLGARNRAEALALAYRLGALDLDS